MLLISAGPVFYAYGVFAPDLVTAFGASRAAVNLALTAVLVVSGLASAPVGWLAARMPLHWLAMGGVLGTAAGLALVAGAQAMWQVIALYTTLISAADVLLGMLVINLLLAHWFERRRGLAIGIAALGASTAAIVFPPWAAYLQGWLGWRGGFLVFAGLTLLLAPLVWWLARRPAGGIPVWERRLVGGTPPVPAGPPPGWGLFLRSADFWIITLGVGTLMAFNGAVMASLVSHGRALGLDALTAASLVSTVGMTAMIGKLVFGALADRVDLRWALRLGLLAGAVAMALFALAGDGHLLYVAALIYGLSLGAMLPVWGALTAECFGLGHYGRALGATRAAMTPVNFAYPLLVGAVFDCTGSYRPAWAILSALALVALGLSFLRSRPAR
ncbi:MFS transporter [Nitrospirillum sp. BR 11164]|uniref:MFS transporter n=1 Tax=Nitrospirillum sp. BR 11164 TaxID=3104324 RepID=UPI002AFEF6AD|nr:MFS transporter [Nitrospirillum sp. BR 11164]MEA1652841.1 MFS transporter [Nitrospirillum sp. BR 11164]